jgi:hypothetical protein
MELFIKIESQGVKQELLLLTEDVGLTKKELKQQKYTTNVMAA